MKSLKLILFALSLFVFFASCSSENPIIEELEFRQARSEQEFASDSRLTAQPGSVVIAQLELTVLTSADEIFDTFTAEKGKDRIPYTFTNAANFTYRLESTDIYTIEFKDLNNNLIFKLDKNTLEWSGNINAGTYYLDIIKTNTSALTNKYIPVIIQPDYEKISESKVNSPQYYKKSDLFTLISSTSCKNADLSKGNFKKMFLSGIDFSKSKMMSAVFSGSDLRKSIFDECDLFNVKMDSSANLTDASMKNIKNMSLTNFYKANLSYVNFGDTLFSRDAVFTWAILRNVSANNAVFERADFRSCDMSNSKILNSSMTYSNLNDSKFAYSTLNEIDMSHSSLSASTDFRSAYLIKAKINYCTLTGTTFYLTHLDSAEIKNSVANSSVYKSCYLNGASLEFSQLNFSSMINSDLSGTNFCNASIESINLQNVKTDENTSCLK